MKLDGDRRELREGGVARSRRSEYSLRFFQRRCGEMAEATRLKIRYNENSLRVRVPICLGLAR